MAKRPAFAIGEHKVPPGERVTVDLPISVLSNHTPVTLPVHVVHGAKAGPTLFVSAAVHGDEILGVEIVRRLLRVPALKHLHGTLLAIPIVNSFGFLAQTRYLPDRRDLNRSFPGSAKGSLASRIAHLFMSEIVARSDFGIDLHTAAVHRVNLPQIRVSPSRPQTFELATAFGATLVVRAQLRDGSLRAAAQQSDVDVLLYEAGEALRFDEVPIRIGLNGVINVMRALDMLPRRKRRAAQAVPFVAKTGTWIRAPEGGLLRTYKTIGDVVELDDILAIVSDPFGDMETEIRASVAGLIIGRTNLPVINQGDALFHIAMIEADATAGTLATQVELTLQPDAILDEDEII